MRTYVDSDILIWHLRGERKALDFIKLLRDKDEYELWIGAMQRAELVFFMRPGEKEKTELLLSLFQTASVDQEIIDIASELYRQWNPSHGVDVHDAILAATAMQMGGKIFSMNLKHYPMPNLLVQTGW